MEHLDAKHALDPDPYLPCHIPPCEPLHDVVSRHAPASVVQPGRILHDRRRLNLAARAGTPGAEGTHLRRMTKLCRPMKVSPGV